MQLKAATMGRSSRRFAGQLPDVLPATDIIASGLFFACICVVGVSLMSLTTKWAMNIKQPDVDILFPTPLPIRALLAFRVFRDTITTLIVPIFFGIWFMGRSLMSIHQWAQQNNQEAMIGLTYRLTFLGYVLQSIFWAMAGLALSLYVQRQNVQGEKAKKLVEWVVFVVILGAGLVIWYLSYQHGWWETLNTLRSSRIAQLIFFPATANAAIGLAPMTGNWMAAGVGAGVLLLGSWACWELAARQGAWYYENSALVSSTLQSQVRGTNRHEAVTKMWADRAQKGKVKIRKNRFAEARWTGFGALVWKEIILQSRMMNAMQWLAPSFGIAIGAGAWYVVNNLVPERRQGNIDVLMFGSLAGPLAYLTFILGSIGSAYAFSSMLRLGDIQKPLPFTPGQYVRFEVLAKAIYPAVASVLAALVVLILSPRFYQASLATMLVVPTFALVASAMNGVIVLMFPDDDPTQKGFRGLLSMVAMLVLAGPPFVLMIGGLVLKLNMVLVATVTSLVNVGLAFLATELGGRFYANFNPSE